MTPKIITAAERAARRGQSAPKPVGYLYKKNPDGTRCKTCRPVPVYARQSPIQPLSPSQPTSDHALSDDDASHPGSPDAHLR